MSIPSIMKQLLTLLTTLFTIALCSCSKEGKKQEASLNAMETQLAGTWYKTKEDHYYANWYGRDTMIAYTSYDLTSYIEFKKTYAQGGKGLAYTVTPIGDAGNMQELTEGYWYYDEADSRIIFDNYWIDVMSITGSDLILKRIDRPDSVVSYYHR